MRFTTDLASIALDYAAAHRIESWDGYLVAMARKFDAKLLFSMDEELGDILDGEGLIVVNPFAADKVRQYHKFLEW